MDTNGEMLTDAEYWFLDGYLGYNYESDMPDGAWLQSMVDLVDMYECDPEPLGPDFRGRDSHDIVMAFLERKATEEEK